VNELVRMQILGKIGLLCVVVLIATTNAAPQHKKSSDKTVLCHFSSWSAYMSGRDKHDVEDINATLCTHVTYDYAGIRDNHTIASLDPWNDLDENYGAGAFRRFTGLCKKAGAVPMLTIGGWNEGSRKYSEMASSAATRKTFIDSVVQFLEKFEFQGLNIDWEYPTLRGGKPEDRVNFPLLLKETKTEFTAHGLILGATVAGTPHELDDVYDLPAISKWVDMIDLQWTTSVFPLDAWDKEILTHHDTALNKHPLDKGNYNVRYVVEYCLKKGVNSSKLLLGVSAIGGRYTLKHPATDRGLYAETTQPAQPEWLTYNQICKLQMKEKWLITRDEHVGAPYGFYSGNQWCAYEEKYSIINKVKLVVEKHLGGASLYNLASDNFSGDCKLGKYPLLTTLHNNILQKTGA